MISALGNIGLILASIATVGWMSNALTGWRRSNTPWMVSYLAAFILLMIEHLWKHQWSKATVSAFMVAVYLWILWQHTRKHRKRAAELLGAKSRALRDALVRKVRETLQPRPVLRPVPVPGR